MPDIVVENDPTVITVVTPQGVTVSVPVTEQSVTVAPTGPQGASWSRTFETVAANLESMDIIATSASATQVVKTFDAGDGKTITLTLNISAETGLPTTKVLSGDGLPVGIATVCTYDFSGGTDRPPKKTYA